jgi:hypothetical protein
VRIYPVRWFDHRNYWRSVVDWEGAGMTDLSLYETFDVQKQIMIDYLLLCVVREDWHGVSDAANDIREMEAAQAANNFKPRS